MQNLSPRCSVDLRYLEQGQAQIVAVATSDATSSLSCHSLTEAAVKGGQMLPETIPFSTGKHYFERQPGGWFVPNYDVVDGRVSYPAALSMDKEEEMETSGWSQEDDHDDSSPAEQFSFVFQKKKDHDKFCSEIIDENNYKVFARFEED